MVRDLYFIPNMLELHSHGTYVKQQRTSIKMSELCSSDKRKPQWLKAMKTLFMSVLGARHGFAKDCVLCGKHHYPPACQSHHCLKHGNVCGSGKSIFLEGLESVIATQ